MSKGNSSRRSLVINVVLIGVGFGLLALAIYGNRDKLRDVFQRPVDYRMFVLAFGIYLIALNTTFVRWFLLVRAVNLPFRLLDAVKLGFIGNVFNLVIPGAVGGDVVKAVFLSRAHPERKASAVASMVIDRILGLAGLFLLAGVAGVFALGRANVQVKILIGIVWLLLAAGLTVLFVLFQPRLYPILDRLTRTKPKLARVVRELETAASAYRSKTRLVVGSLLVSACIHSLFVMAFYAVSRAVFDELPSFAEHFLIVPLVLFSTAVPLPFGALGVSENISGILFAMGGTGDPQTAAANGLVAMMAFRTIMYASGVVGLFVYLANLRWVRELTNPSARDEADSRD